MLQAQRAATLVVVRAPVRAVPLVLSLITVLRNVAYARLVVSLLLVLRRAMHAPLASIPCLDRNATCVPQEVLAVQQAEPPVLPVHQASTPLLAHRAALTALFLLCFKTIKVAVVVLEVLVLAMANRCSLKA